jgi:Zn-dependent protease/CBS domain-containing protein
VVIHELSHSVVARHYNIKVRDIVLYPIGGVSEIDEIPDKPSVEWRMAIAGPLVSLVISGVLFVLSQVVSIETPAVPPFTTAGSLMLDLANLNLLLGAFNLVPAFPMDGGRVLRAFLAERMKFSDATRYAASIGKILGMVFAVFGALYDFWLIIIGLFVYIGADEEAQSTIVSTAIAGIRVKDVMYQEVASAKPETTLTEAMDTMFKARYHDLLVEKDGIFQGIVTWDEIKKVKPEERSEMRVGQLPAKRISISPNESILEAYKIMTREKIDLVPVVDKETPNKVIGAVTGESVTYAYERSKSLH